jgi:hypothetical protein
MVERSEEDKLLRAPIKVVLGGEEYDIDPLPIGESRKWRTKLVKVLSKLPEYAQQSKVNTDSPDEFAKAINNMLVVMADDVADLFFGYAMKLDREHIEAIATDAELGKAFGEVVTFAISPFAKSLTASLSKLSQ